MTTPPQQKTVNPLPAVTINLEHDAQMRAIDEAITREQNQTNSTQLSTNKSK